MKPVISNVYVPVTGERLERRLGARARVNLLQDVPGRVLQGQDEVRRAGRDRVDEPRIVSPGGAVERDARGRGGRGDLTRLAEQRVAERRAVRVERVVPLQVDEPVPPSLALPPSEVLRDVDAGARVEVLEAAGVERGVDPSRLMFDASPGLSGGDDRNGAW